MQTSSLPRRPGETDKSDRISSDSENTQLHFSRNSSWFLSKRCRPNPPSSCSGLPTSCQTKFYFPCSLQAVWLHWEMLSFLWVGWCPHARRKCDCQPLRRWAGSWKYRRWSWKPWCWAFSCTHRRIHKVYLIRLISGCLAAGKNSMGALFCMPTTGRYTPVIVCPDPRSLPKKDSCARPANRKFWKWSANPETGRVCRRIFVQGLPVQGAWVVRWKYFWPWRRDPQFPSLLLKRPVNEMVTGWFW